MTRIALCPICWHPVEPVDRDCVATAKRIVIEQGRPRLTGLNVGCGTCRTAVATAPWLARWGASAAPYREVR